MKINNNLLSIAIAPLAKDEIHVWWASLDQPYVSYEELKTVLSAEELKRAARFKFPIDQQRFIAARGQLRLLLASYLHIEPAAIEFIYNEYGKPSLAGTLAVTKLEFNLAHSKGRAVYAFSLEVPVGIDLEHKQRELEAAALTQRFLSQQEYQHLTALPVALQNEGFLRAWTRKEAIIKALGLGLSFPLDQFTVSLSPDQPAELLNIHNDDAKAWSLISLELDPDWLAALAFRDHNYQVSLKNLVNS